MPIPPGAVDISSNASVPLLKLQQLHLSTAALLLGLWQLVQGLTIALLACLVAKTAAAKSSVKENARSSLLLLKHASRSTSGHVATWLHIHISSSSSSCSAGTCSKKAGVPAVAQNRSSIHSKQQLPLNRSNASIATACAPAAAAAAAGAVQQEQCRLLLPPQLPHHSGRLTVVLDLDETLLCTYRLQQGPDSLQLVPSNNASPSSSSSSSSSSSRWRHSLASMLFSSASSICSNVSTRRRSNSSSSGYTVTCSSPCEGTLGMLGREVSATCWLHYVPTNSSTAASFGHSSNSSGTTTLAVFERPGVRLFLQELSSFAEVVLFTAASPAYAAPLVDLLDPQADIFSARLYSDACVAAAGRQGVKDMAGFARPLGRVVLVDNSPYSFLLQPANGLPCMPYHGQRGDGQLLGVILPLLRSLAQLGDIRPLLEAKFRVREWLASKGCEVPPPHAEEVWG